MRKAEEKEFEIKYPTMAAWGKLPKEVIRGIQEFVEFVQNANISLDECSDTDILSLIASMNKIDYSELQKERSMFEAEIQGEVNGD